MFETILMVGGLALFLSMLFAMGLAEGEGWYLSPLLLATAGMLLLWPLREERAARTVLLAGGTLLLVWLLEVLGGVLLPFVIVFILASLFNPLVALLQGRFRIPRWISSLMVTSLVLGLLSLIVFQLVPSLIGQVETLAQRAFEGVDSVQEWLATTSVLDGFEQAGLLDRDELVEEFALSVQGMTDSLAENLPNLAQNLIGYFSSLMGLFISIGIIPVALYYLLKDYPHITRRLVELFPTFGGRRDYLVEATEVVGSYLRGQLMISAIAAFNVTVALLLFDLLFFDIPFALLIGLLAGLLNMIPSIGAIITDIVGVLLAVVFGDPWLLTALVIFGVLMAQNVLEQSILTPKILSQQVGLHPVLILLSLFVFGYFLGLLGLIIAVPVTALIMTTYKAYRHELTLELSSDARLKKDLARRLFQRFRSGPEAHAEEESP